MSHTGAADSLDQCLFDNTVLDIKRKLTGSLLGCAPTDTVCETGDISDFLGMNPLTLFRIGAGSCFAPFATGHISSTSFV